MSINETSQIKEFYKNQTVFLTGGNGFIGKILVEKLLRTCDDLTKIFLLVRFKKNKTPDERFQSLLSSPCFDKVKKLKPDVIKKIKLINGDCTKANLGLSEEDLKIVKEETTCVIHAAASVRFDQPIKAASQYVLGTRDLLNISKEMKKLKSFVYVSTAYSNCNQPEIYEAFYPPPIKAEDLLHLVNAVDENVLIRMTPALLDKFPNTYIYTKCVSEDLVRSYIKSLPICIIRPAIVVASAKEPIPGWLDNMMGCIGVAFVVSLGICHTMLADKNGISKEVPADYVANFTLAAAWKRSISNEPVIYNFVGDERVQLTYGGQIDKLISIYKEKPTLQAIWYPSFSFTKSKLCSDIRKLLLHQIPAHIIDFVFLCLGKKPMLVKLYTKMHDTLDSVSYFALRQWKFYHENVDNLWNELSNEDKKLFHFSMENFDMDKHYNNSIDVGRFMLLQIKSDPLIKAKLKLRFLGVLHYSFLLLVWYLIYRLAKVIFNVFL